jgi:hypothetical protein
VSLCSVKRYFRIAQREASLAPRKGGGRPPKTDEAAHKLLEEDVQERPAGTVSERRRFLERTTGKALSDSAVKRLLKRLGFSQETDCGGDGARRMAKGAWRVIVARGIATERLVFADEMGTNTSLSPLYAWSTRGERAHCSVPRNRGSNTTRLASMTVGGMGPCLAVEGATTAAVFEAHIENVSVPSFGAGSWW